MVENKIIPVTAQSAKIRLGVSNTLNAGTASFDISAWVDRFGADGTVEIHHKRPGDELSYKVAQVKTENGVATWTFNELDTSKHGYGEASVLYKKNEAYVARTAVFITYTAETVLEPGVNYGKIEWNGATLRVS